MTPRTPVPSSRLLKAAVAERAQLARHRSELLQARATLRSELDCIEASLQAVSDRETLLERLAGPAPSPSQAAERARVAAPPAGEQVAGEDACATVVRGPAIRREAVRVMLAHPEQAEALHYRAWFALLQDAGFRVAGKDPLATFLTQLSRSPAVHKSTRAGVYGLDRDAPQRLRRRRDELHEQLRRLTAPPSRDVDGAQLRARRTELNSELGRVEKALEEVELLFSAAPAGERALAATA